MEEGTSAEKEKNLQKATIVELLISCRNLVEKNEDVPNPICLAYGKEFLSNVCSEMGRTELLDSCDNPTFAKKIPFVYVFEQRQHLRFVVFSRKNKNYEVLGSIECTLGEIIAERHFSRNLEGQEEGTITVIAHEQSASKEEVSLVFCGRNLDKKDLFGKSDPFLCLYTANEEDDTFEIVHQTEVIKKTLNPEWKPFTLRTSVLCSDYEQVILIKCFDWNRNGKSSFIGEVATTMNVITSHPKGCSWQLMKNNENLKKKPRVSGQLLMTSCQVRPFYTFMDYIQNGTELSCTISIDFTLSNGNPRHKSSLHHMHPDIPNQYHRALEAVGEIIQDYDSDKLFPVVGFGAKLPDGHNSDMFFVNLDNPSPMCSGISGVLKAYHNCLDKVELFGPTNFAPSINHVARNAAEKKDGSEYFILLILTDGCVTDMEATKEAVVNASSLPLSIIIIGIGQANFRAMDVLDGDVEPVSYQGRYAERDIVQFVPFRDFIRDTSHQQMEISQVQLANEVLGEIPQQFLSYMTSNKITPGAWKTEESPPPEEPKPRTLTVSRSTSTRMRKISKVQEIEGHHSD